jgi:uncharacterized protein HemY
MAAKKHDKALDLTEQALEKLADGDDKAADQLIGQAQRLDPEAPKEVVNDIDEEFVHQRAYQIWERAGRPEGRDQEHWEQARREIEAENKKT